MPDFLLEIGCEEIPARMIDAASQELRDRVSALLARERLAATEITNFDTPRRLAVFASGIPATQPDVTEQVNGPSASIAYKDGQPTPAAHAFAKKAGVEVSQLEKITTPKGEYLPRRSLKKGGPPPKFSRKIFPRKSPQSIGRKICTGANRARDLCVRFAGWWQCWTTKSFRWNSAEFEAGKTSRGHRILSRGEVMIRQAGPAYVEALRAAKVLGRSEREHQIRKALDAATRTSLELAGVRTNLCSIRW